MSRFHQRLREHLQNEEFAARYREMEAEIELIQAIEDAREKPQVSTKRWTRSGKQNKRGWP